MASVLILVFVGLSVVDLGLMYACVIDRQTSDIRCASSFNGLYARNYFGCNASTWQTDGQIDKQTEWTTGKTGLTHSVACVNSFIEL